jgi:protein tyrosine phosphatase (PTP) superfamily phosphohydrolase (DUF442 family)
LNFSRITDEVLVGTTPQAADFVRLYDMGVRLVINMRLLRGRAPQAEAPTVRYLRLRTFDNPLLPIPTTSLVRGVRAALQVIQEGGSVYAHCSRGRHRSVAMAAAILIALGRSPEEAMALIKRQRPHADPEAAHIRSRIYQFDRAWALAINAGT